MTKRVGDVRFLVVALGVLLISEVCSALVRRSIPVHYIHWAIKPILGFANAPADEGFLWTTGDIARLLHSGVVITAAAAGVWLASKGRGPVRSGWYGVGLGLFIGGAAANAYQLLMIGSVLDWITFRPLAVLGWPEGYPTYSLGDAAVALGIVALITLVLFRSTRMKPRIDEHRAPTGLDRPTGT